MRKEILFPATAVVLGGVGFGLRKWELATAFEPETGLVTPGMPSTAALIFLSVVAAVLFLFFAWGKHSMFSGGYDEAFAAKDNRLYMGSVVLAAFLLLGAAVLKGMSLSTLFRTAADRAAMGAGGNPVLALFLPLLVAVLCVVSAVCILSAGRKCYRGEPIGRYSFLPLAPAYLCCLWLIAAYQGRAADPVVQDYIYELLAIICALLSFYYVASFSFEKPKTRRAIFFSLLAVYFGLVTLADRHDGSTMVLYGFSILYPLIHVAVLLYQDGLPHASPAPEQLPMYEEDDVRSEEHETEGNPNEG